MYSTDRVQVAYNPLAPNNSEATAQSIFRVLKVKASWTRWGISPLEFYYRSTMVATDGWRCGGATVACSILQGDTILTSFCRVSGQFVDERDDLIRPFNLCSNGKWVVLCGSARCADGCCGYAASGVGSERNGASIWRNFNLNTKSR